MPSGGVALYFSRLGAPMYVHEKITLFTVAKAIAQINNCQFLGSFDHRPHHSGKVFLVPDDTLIIDEALWLNACCENDLFGGVVPCPFVKTKAITHPLVTACADRPPGWSIGFAKRAGDFVLPGYTAFCARDARLAATRLLMAGTVRVKDPLGSGGVGQKLVITVAELDALLEQFPYDKIAAHGLVLEANLCPIATRSVGQVTVEDIMITYHACNGSQRITPGNWFMAGPISSVCTGDGVHSVLSG
jgi:Protein of unknown function (DUF3182)